MRKIIAELAGKPVELQKEPNDSFGFFKCSDIITRDEGLHIANRIWFGKKVEVVGFTYHPDHRLWGVMKEEEKAYWVGEDDLDGLILLERPGYLRIGREVFVEDKKLGLIEGKIIVINPDPSCQKHYLVEIYDDRADDIIVGPDEPWCPVRYRNEELVRFRWCDRKIMKGREPKYSY